MKLTGVSEAETTTAATGAYSFTGLRAGVYTVEISGFDDEDIGFSATTSVAELTVGATEELDFQATYMRVSAIMGQVTGWLESRSACRAWTGTSRSAPTAAVSSASRTFARASTRSRFRATTPTSTAST
ncbi:MAG: hypothetical protein J4F34_02600 [Gemmatimonadetes bacterium]|nr:hypothetical protein [Gemmatimonadota bacterium]